MSRPIRYLIDPMALRRLKQRLSRISWMFERISSPDRMRREMNRVIEEWAAAERKKLP
jgi:hypothetical protein